MKNIHRKLWNYSGILNPIWVKFHLEDMRKLKFLLLIPWSTLVILVNNTSLSVVSQLQIIFTWPNTPIFITVGLKSYFSYSQTMLLCFSTSKYLLWQPHSQIYIIWSWAQCLYAFLAFFLNIRIDVCHYLKKDDKIIEKM